MSIADERYVALSTYRKSGDAVTTATWIAPLDGGRLGFWTASTSGKVKRLRTNPRVTLRPSDQRGRPKEGAQALEATAELLTSGADFDTVQATITKKYGWQVGMSKFFNWAAHLGRGKNPYGDVVVVLTPTA